MPGALLKVPADIRSLIRRMHPPLKRKVRAALSDILEDPACGKALKEDLATGACPSDERAPSIAQEMMVSKSLRSDREKQSTRMPSDKSFSTDRNPEKFSAD